MYFQVLEVALQPYMVNTRINQSTAASLDEVVLVNHAVHTSGSQSPIYFAELLPILSRVYTQWYMVGTAAVRATCTTTLCTTLYTL